jgi:hypothetical protein
VGGVPEVLPEEIIIFSQPDEDGKNSIFFKKICC